MPREEHKRVKCDVGKVSKLSSNAVKAFKLGSYKTAALLFTQAIALQTDLDFQTKLKLYDRRSATFEKLGDFLAAYKDGKKMIELDPQCAKGYLRAGNVGQLANKDTKAYEIYQIAIARVPVNDPHYKILESQLRAVEKRLKETNLFQSTCDITKILPSEIANIVFTYLSFNQIISCRRVCKAWNSYITTQPRLFRDLDFASHGRNIGRQQIQKCLQYSKNKSKKLLVDLRRLKSDNVLDELAKSLRRLTSLAIYNIQATLAMTFARTITSITLHGPPVLNMIWTVLNQFTALESAKFLDCDPKVTHISNREPFVYLLKHLVIVAKQNTPSALPESLRAAKAYAFFPSLQNLHISGWRDASTGIPTDYRPYEQLESLVLDKGAMSELPLLGPRITSFSFTDQFLDQLQPTHENFLVPPYLECLDISNCSRINVQTFNKLTASLEKNLRSLVMNYVQIPVSVILRNCSFHTHLQYLSVSGNGDLSDNNLKTIADTFSELVQVDVSDCFNITGVSIIYLAYNRKATLRRYDSVEWVRGNGIAAECKLAKPLKGGKKFKG
ncbi:F-box/TPR repeat protein pof3 [Neolecta irregularis DAH-3]|uniref:F-box/TPR repeat protein pof3 n=1 Tax=Neolecta irregularis (strain DAH-3) TaxID=1198029 RepID=A0A1U7LMV6_NEOID|nr:F-box/TPR repeat protein pof3 [Neolecta irregularis DAH-3]|eukprot:OLL23913.1 F-box/TPR repeat protein pof3 [Neolecta irregularis DAH-3]